MPSFSFGVSGLIGACTVLLFVGPETVSAQPHLCNGVGRRYCAKAHLVKECPKTCLPEHCEGRRLYGYRRCETNRRATCRDYKWEDIVTGGWYDYVYLNKRQICVSTCREEPKAMRCKQRTWFKGTRYCAQTDCSNAYSPEQSGCHQERDFHKPTCRECAHIFATACKHLYTPEQLVDRLTRDDRSESNSDSSDQSDSSAKSEEAPRVSVPALPSAAKNITNSSATPPASKATANPAGANPKAKKPGTYAWKPTKDVQVNAEDGENHVEITEYIENWAELDVADNDPIAAFHILDPDQDSLTPKNHHTESVVSLTFQVQSDSSHFLSAKNQVVALLAEILALDPEDFIVIRPSSVSSGARHRRLQGDDLQETEDDGDHITTVTMIITCEEPKEIARELDILDRDGQLQAALLDQAGVNFLDGSLASHILVVPKSILTGDASTFTAAANQTSWFIILASLVGLAVSIAILVGIVMYISAMRRNGAESGLQKPAQVEKPPIGNNTIRRSSTNDHYSVALSPPRTAQKAHKRSISVDVGSITLTEMRLPPRQSGDGA